MLFQRNKRGSNQPLFGDNVRSTRRMMSLSTPRRQKVEHTLSALHIIAIRLRYDYDPTTTYRARLHPFDAIRRKQKVNMSIFRRILVVVVS